MEDGGKRGTMQAGGTALFSFRLWHVPGAALAAAPPVAATAAAAALTAAAATALAKPAAASLAEPAVTWLLHDRERLLWWRPHLHQEQVRCRRQGARPVRPDRNHELGDHELVSARLPAHRVLPLRLGWQRLWLVLLKQQVHLRLHLALAAAFPGAVPRLVGRDVTATQQAS